jgi:SNF family Na+-dependent transporter
MARQRWGSKLGVILAVAGSAVGLGNLLRFPGVAAKNGGGAFMIPYFIALFLLGLPLMWIEWTIGRFGGGFGHSTAPGIFHTLWNKNRFIKYFGVIGIFGPIVIFIYYTYIESWLLGYAWMAATGAYAGCTDAPSMTAFLNGYRGVETNAHFSGIGTAYGFFLVTFALNIGIVALGIRRGIETVCKISLPLLFILAVILVVRVFTLGTPDPAHPDWNISAGLGFLWNPDWSALASGKVWLAAAGQIFFTLSCGIGVILTYSSYLTHRDDVALSGLSAAATNEMVEVVLGGSLVIPAALAFFGPDGTRAVAESTFDLAFVTMPLVLQKLAFGQVLGLAWFLLLFVAGLTSSISLVQPAIAFLEDEFGLTRRRAILAFALITLLATQACIFGLARGVVDEFDFWGGNFCLVLFATVEAILFAWVFGMERAWTQLHAGSDITIPRIYRFIIKYITPVFLLVILGAWFYQSGWDVIWMKNVPPENFWTVLGTRAMLAALFIALAVMVKILWRRRRRAGLEGAPT